MDEPADESGDALATQIAARKPTPIASLSPELAEQTAAIRGEVTIVWPYNSVTKTIAFLLAEPDVRLRRAKGQVRVQLCGSSAKAVVETGIGAGDTLLLGLDGAEWAPDESPGSALGARSDWQLGFGEKLLLQALLGEARETKTIYVDHPAQRAHGGANGIPEAETIVSLETPATRASSASPATHSPPRPPPPAPVRRAPDLLGGEYNSPAFLKRSRLSYGSIFEGGFDPFEEDGGVRGQGRKRLRFSLDARPWKYASRTPSPEPEHPPEENAMDESEDQIREDAQRPSSRATNAQTWDQGCQTIENEMPPAPSRRTDRPNPYSLLSHEPAPEPVPKQAPEQAPEPAPKPDSEPGSEPGPDQNGQVFGKHIFGVEGRSAFSMFGPAPPVQTNSGIGMADQVRFGFAHTPETNPFDAPPVDPFSAPPDPPDSEYPEEYLNTPLQHKENILVDNEETHQSSSEWGVEDGDGIELDEDGDQIEEGDYDQRAHLIPADDDGGSDEQERAAYGYEEGEEAEEYDEDDESGEDPEELDYSDGEEEEQEAVASGPYRRPAISRVPASTEPVFIDLISDSEDDEPPAPCHKPPQHPSKSPVHLDSATAAVPSTQIQPFITVGRVARKKLGETKEKALEPDVSSSDSERTRGESHQADEDPIENERVLSQHPEDNGISPGEGDEISGDDNVDQDDRDHGRGDEGSNAITDGEESTIEQHGRPPNDDEPNEIMAHQVHADELSVSQNMSEEARSGAEPELQDGGATADEMTLVPRRMSEGRGEKDSEVTQTDEDDKGGLASRGTTRDSGELRIHQNLAGQDDTMEESQHRPGRESGLASTCTRPDTLVASDLPRPAHQHHYELATPVQGDKAPDSTSTSNARFVTPAVDPELFQSTKKSLLANVAAPERQQSLLTPDQTRAGPQKVAEGPTLRESWEGDVGVVEEVTMEGIVEVDVVVKAASVDGQDEHDGAEEGEEMREVEVPGGNDVDMADSVSLGEGVTTVEMDLDIVGGETDQMDLVAEGPEVDAATVQAKKRVDIQRAHSHATRESEDDELQLSPSPPRHPQTANVPKPRHTPEEGEPSPAPKIQVIEDEDGDHEVGNEGETVHSASRTSAKKTKSNAQKHASQSSTPRGAARKRAKKSSQATTANAAYKPASDDESDMSADDSILLAQTSRGATATKRQKDLRQQKKGQLQKEAVSPNEAEGRDSSPDMSIALAKQQATVPKRRKQAAAGAAAGAASPAAGKAISLSDSPLAKSPAAAATGAAPSMMLKKLPDPINRGSSSPMMTRARTGSSQQQPQLFSAKSASQDKIETYDHDDDDQDDHDDEGDLSIQLARGSAKASAVMSPPRLTRGTAAALAAASASAAAAPAQHDVPEHRLRSHGRSLSISTASTAAFSQSQQSLPATPTSSMALNNSNNNPTATIANFSSTSSRDVAYRLKADLAECLPLRDLRHHVNRVVPEVVGVVARSPTEPARAKGGPREYVMSFRVTDPANGPGGRPPLAEVQLFRPHKDTLPRVAVGDAVLLRGFQVRALAGKGFGLRSSGESAWAVWSDSDNGDADADGADRHGDEDEGGGRKPQMRGPPVEDWEKYGPDMAMLRGWYAGMDQAARSRLEKANRKFEETG